MAVERGKKKKEEEVRGRGSPKEGNVSIASTRRQEPRGPVGMRGLESQGLISMMQPSASWTSKRFLSTVLAFLTLFGAQLHIASCI